MQQNKENLFQFFSNSIDSQNQPKQEIKPIHKRKQRRASTTTNLVAKNISFDCIKLRQINPSLCKSFHMFKKCVSSEQIFYGKTSQEELFKMLHHYLTEVIDDNTQLTNNIKSMHFQNSEKNKKMRLSAFGNSIKEDYVCDLDRILSQQNLAKSVSIEQSNGFKNTSGLILALDKNLNIQEPLSREISSIEEVESEIMEDTIKRNQTNDVSSLQDVENNQIHCRQSSIKFDLDFSPKKQHPQNVNPSIQIMINHSSGGLLAAENNLSNHMDNSNTSFGFEFDQIKQIDKNVLQQVSLLYLNNQSRGKNQSQISLSIRDSNGPESSWFSDCSSEEISVHEISQKLNIALSQEFLEKLYFEPEPFLVTISLIYLLKYLYHSGHKLSSQSASILLTTSLLVSYKIYEDLQLNGLVQFLVDDVLEKKVTKEELVRFERHYLETMGYEVVISNEQFYKMLGIIKGKI